MPYRFWGLLDSCLAAYEYTEQDQQNFDNLIQSINDGTRPSSGPWVISPVPPDADPILAHLHNTMNRLAEREQNEQSKKQSG